MPGGVDCIDCNSLFTVDIMTITGPIDINWRYFDIFFLIQRAIERSSDLSFLLRRVVESGTAMRLVMFVLVALATIALATQKKNGKKSGRRGISAAEWGAHASNPREDEIEHMMDDGFNDTAGNKVHGVLPYTIERARHGTFT